MPNNLLSILLHHLRSEILYPNLLSDVLEIAWYILAFGLLAIGTASKCFVMLREVLKYGKTSTSANTTTTTYLSYLYLPKSSFIHFYIVGITINFSILALTWQTQYPGVLPILFQLHLYRRLYECIYIHTFSDAKINVAHYIFGILFYVLVPLTFHTLSVTIDTNITNSNWSVFLFCLGLLIVILSSYEQFCVHHILANLRQRKEGYNKLFVEKQKNYFIPYGHLFYYVSSPHYTCEIFLYLGFSLIALSYPQQQHRNTDLYPFTNVSLAFRLCQGFVLVVFINLNLSSNETHEWYELRFGDKYKRLKRKRLIPFFW